MQAGHAGRDDEALLPPYRCVGHRRGDRDGPATRWTARGASRTHRALSPQASRPGHGRRQEQGQDGHQRRPYPCLARSAPLPSCPSSPRLVSHGSLLVASRRSSCAPPRADGHGQPLDRPYPDALRSHRVPLPVPLILSPAPSGRQGRLGGAPLLLVLTPGRTVSRSESPCIRTRAVLRVLPLASLVRAWPRRARAPALCRVYHGP